MVETQWPQWITTFPTVIETICSLHTKLLTNSGLYSWKISNQIVSPTWLMLHCFSTSFPLLLPPWGSHNPLCQWLAELNHLNSQLKALGPSVITQPHPYEGVQSPHQQLLSLPCTDSSNNWEPSWPKGFKAMFSSYFQNCCRPCQYSIPGLAVSGVIWNTVFCLPCPGLLLGQLLPPISLLVGRSLWSQGLKCPVISETGFLVAVREGIQDAKPVSAHFWYLTKLPAWLRRKVIYITLC